ncbi:hypothetical protein ACFQ3W_23345 [Paenibacillus puldeungensis]|uniref:YqzN/YkzM domain-containing protein n=1 Tax=Paenibacillus puldeungensis TaxID=696536 RepID=A0ABW3S3Y2_9BACL
MAKDEQAVEIVSGFTKAQFMESRQWQGIDKDVLSVVLEDDKTYTIAEAKKLINQFNTGKVL